MHVQKELAKVATVTRVVIGQAVVAYDERATSIETLREAVKNAGYAVTSIS